MTNLIGQSIGRYHILEQLGEGGMASVYKAFDTRLERDVAIKVIRMDAFPAQQHERVIKRFEREAKALAHLSHPNILKVLDYGEYDGVPYLVLEYLPGGTLKQKLGQPLPWQEALSLVLPIANALYYAHENGIIHRDIKPSNILLDRKNQLHLTDFGIAKILGLKEGQTLTGAGVGVGTPEYMAPEQGLGKQVDARADMYSLGVVLYELITGRKPYTAETPMAVVLKHVTDPLPRPIKFVPGLPNDVEKLLLKALAKQPEDRYPDMKTLAAAMQTLSDKEVPSAPSPHTQHKESRSGTSFSDSPTTDIVDESGKPQHKKQSPILKNKLARLLLGGITGIALLVLVFFLGFSNWTWIVPTGEGFFTKAPTIFTQSSEITTTIPQIPRKTQSSTPISPTLTPTPTPGIFGGALSIDDQGYGVIGYTSDLDLRKAITIEAWVIVAKYSFDCKTGWTGACGYIPVISQAHQRSSAGIFTLAVGKDGLLFAFEGADSRFMALTEMPLNQWVHIGLVHTYGNSSRTRFYLNGEAITNTKWVDDFGKAITGNDLPRETIESPFWIGKYNINQIPENAVFSIDEIRIWNVARTQDEIINTMQTPLTSIPPGLVAYWSFDNLTESKIVPDMLGNGHDIKLVGSAKIIIR
ncbi:MAG: protein kinase [Candidatus Latescibacteria bacterium]|nr:protein kinase [Candidatus Latescibacterota bacterium]